MYEDDFEEILTKLENAIREITVSTETAKDQFLKTSNDIAALREEITQLRKDISETKKFQQQIIHMLELYEDLSSYLEDGARSKLVH